GVAVLFLLVRQWLCSLAGSREQPPEQAWSIQSIPLPACLVKLSTPRACRRDESGCFVPARPAWAERWVRMQQFTLGGNRSAGDDVGQVAVNGELAPLEGKVRVLVVVLLQQMGRHQQDTRVRLWVRTADLRRVTKARSLQALQKLLSDARTKVWAVGLDVKS